MLLKKLALLMYVTTYTTGMNLYIYLCLIPNDYLHICVCKCSRTQGWEYMNVY